MSAEESLSRSRIIYLIDTFCNGNRMEFSKKTGIGKSSISQYVNGTNAPGNITAKKISDAFNVDPMWVMGFDVPMNPNEADDLRSDQAVPDPKSEQLQALLATMSGEEKGELLNYIQFLLSKRPK